MNTTEVTGLLAMINEYDQRLTITEHTAGAWERALDHGITLDFASNTVIKYYGKEQFRPISIAYLNQMWRSEKRENKVFPGLPEFTGANKEASRWFCMYGILEGVEELNLCRSRDPQAAPILRARDDYAQRTGIPMPMVDARKVFAHLDWEWFDANRDAYSHRIR
jgi:hypothetical protein